MEIIQLLRRELRVIYHKTAEIFNIFIFFIIISFAFSFAASGKLSVSIAASIIIVCFMLSSNLSTHLIFEKEIETGVLQQLFLRLKNLNNLVFAKIIAHYLCFGIPLTIAVPVSALFFNISPQNIFSLLIITTITSFVISIINVMMAGITAGLRSGAVISIILSVPLYIPIIILNISYIDSQTNGDEAISFVSFLQNAFGFILIILPLAVFSIRQTIRNAVGD